MGLLNVQTVRPQISRHNRRRASPRCLAWALACAALALPSAAQEVTGEATAKARLTVTLARFVRWPAAPAASAVAPMRLCVLHQSPAIASAFAAHGGSLVSGRPLAVLSNPEWLPDACDLLFVDGSSPRFMPDVLDTPQRSPRLTLGAVDGFLSRGGMVEIVNINDSLRFDVNLAALRNAGLVLNSQALKLARQVRE